MNTGNLPRTSLAFDILSDAQFFQCHPVHQRLQLTEDEINVKER